MSQGKKCFISQVFEFLGKETVKPLVNQLRVNYSRNLAASFLQKLSFELKVEVDLYFLYELEANYRLLGLMVLVRVESIHVDRKEMWTLLSLLLGQVS